MSVEKDAFDELMDMGVLPADALYSPAKHQENYYSKTLNKRAISGNLSAGGVRGMFKKSSVASSF